MRTGDISERTGVYQNACCSEQRTVAKGTKLPFCMTCGSPAVWILTRPLYGPGASRS